jgi:hypothetical protein
MLAFNAILTGVWLAMTPITLATGLKDSIPYLVFISIWALFASHLAGAVAGLLAVWEVRK